jgi:hypothetical protein
LAPKPDHTVRQNGDLPAADDHGPFAEHRSRQVNIGGRLITCEGAKALWSDLL